MSAMSFSEIASAIDCEIYAGDPAARVSGICVHSSEVSPGDLFVAVRGAVTDGHKYVAEAVSRGASAVITQKRLSGLKISAALAGDSKAAAALAACVFHGYPSRGFTLAGVTGTNGKTTVCHLLHSVWERLGHKPAMIGTVEIRFGDLLEEAQMTTPGAVELQNFFSLMSAGGADRVCMEVSSHAINEKRVEGCEFDAAVFTNLTPEHLDYHGDLRSYADVKKRLFTGLLERSAKKNKFAVINIDDKTGAEIARDTTGEAVSFSAENASAEVFAESFSTGRDGISAALRTPWGNLKISSNLIGAHNLSNLLAAAGCALCLGSAPDEVARALSSGVFVPGRLERVENSGAIDVFVDYAHTADALESIVKAVRPLCRGKMFVVFGCGGDRDRSKRPAMGRVASLNCDVAVLTSDNPRSESPAAIIDEIESGVVAGGCETVKIPDRHEAIRYAIFSAAPGDFVLIAGKGHERYQHIGGEKTPFDDRLCAADFLKEREDAI
ncbi:UDP-N-acetylmuramoyl-L-alanyl-D-glutamate--2,6-diaminopimelate ligase [Candidatus Mycalebacterium sp.]